MSTTAVRTVTFNYNHITDTDVGNGVSYENAKIAQAVKKALNTHVRVFSIEFYGDRITKLNNNISLTKGAAQKITAILQRAKERNTVWNAVTSPTEKVIASKPKSTNPIKKAYTNLRKSNRHCIWADRLEMGLFASAVIVNGLALLLLLGVHGNFSPWMHGFKIGFDVLKWGFGGFNLLIGGILLHQSLINGKKARKSNNGKELGLAIMGGVFACIIFSLGVTSFLNLANNNVFKAQLGICSGFGVGMGLLNLFRLKLLKKELDKAEDLKAFLQKMLQISDEKHQEIENRINALNPVQVFKELKSLKNWNKRFTQEQLNTILNKSFEERKRILILTELEMMQEREKSYFESFFGKKLTQSAINFLNGKNTPENTITKKKLVEELSRRRKMELKRLAAPSIGVGAVIALKMLTIALIANLIFYSGMFISKAVGYRLNFAKRDRIIQTEEDETNERKSAYELAFPQPA